MRKLAWTTVLAGFASVALVACGGGSSSSSTSASTAPPSTTTQAAGGGAKSTLKAEADPSGNLKYTQSKLSAKAGQVTVDFNNPSSLAHNFTIETSSGQEVGATDTITGGKTSTTVNLKPGTYKFLCTVDGHAAAGMEGTLTVK